MIKPIQYGKDVLSGKVNVCEYVRLSVQRHFDDLEKDWEFYFDEEEGLKWCRAARILVLWEGEFAGQNFMPQSFQDWILYSAFGWKRKDNHTRRFKYIYIEIPRKNGKTTLLGVVANIHFRMDNENAPKVYFVASKYSQAYEGLEDAINIAAATPSLAERYTIYKRSLEDKVRKGQMLALGGDSKKQSGLNPSFVGVDELHEHPDRDMFDKMDTAFGMRRQPTMFIITTAGHNRYSFCYEYRQKCISVLKGKAVQDNLYAIIYTIDEGDDWRDPSVWEKANPSWDIINKIDFAQSAEEASKFSGSEVSFKNYRLNIWTDAPTVWIKDSDWKRCAGPVKENELKGVKCYAGSDFAETKDLNALVLNFPLSDGTRHIKSFFWIPEKKVREKEDHVPYWQWKKDGLINVIGGDAINHEDLAVEIMAVLSRYNVQGMTYDKYGIGEAVIQSMINRGYPTNKLHPEKQGTTQMQGPIRMMEEEILLQKINHEGNPILEWNVANVILYMDSYGGVKFNKGKAIDKIDGAVAMAMSFMEEINSKGNGPIKLTNITFV